MALKADSPSRAQITSRSCWRRNAMSPLVASLSRSATSTTGFCLYIMEGSRPLRRAGTRPGVHRAGPRAGGRLLLELAQGVDHRVEARDLAHVAGGRADVLVGHPALPIDHEHSAAAVTLLRIENPVGLAHLVLEVRE